MHKPHPAPPLLSGQNGLTATLVPRGCLGSSLPCGLTLPCCGQHAASLATAAVPTNTPRTAPLTGTQTAVSRLECTLAEPDVVRAYQFVTANDNTKRDPLDWQIYRRDQTPRPDGQGGFEVPPGGSPI